MFTKQELTFLAYILETYISDRAPQPGEMKPEYDLLFKVQRLEAEAD